MAIFIALNIHWKDWCGSWNSSTLATWWEELTHWKRPWCWERLKAGGEVDGSWKASPTWWTWVWASLGVGDGQRSLECCSPWGLKESGTTEPLNWTDDCIKRWGLCFLSLLFLILIPPTESTLDDVDNFLSVYKLNPGRKCRFYK